MIDRSKTNVIALVGVMGALEFVAMFLETVVFATLAPPCVISLSIALALCLYSDWKRMFVGGTIMGCCSFFIAIIVSNPAFLLPWNSILPRVVMGIVAYGVCKLFKLILKNARNKYVKNFLPYALGAVFGALTNTALVLSLLLLQKFTGVEEVLAVIMAVNFPLEVFGSALIVPFLVIAVNKSKRIGVS